MDADKFNKDLLPDLIRHQAVKGRNELYRRYACVLYGIIKPIITDNHQSEDVLQKTFDNIFEKIDYYQPECSSFLTWAMQVARATSIAYVCNTKQALQTKYFTEPKTQTGQLELIMIPNVSVETTGPDFLNMILKGCTVSEISAELNIPVEVVKMSIRKAMLMKAKRI